MSKPSKRMVAVTPTVGAESSPTLGEVKALLRQYTLPRAGGVEEISEANLQEAFNLICAIARRYGIDPEQALQRYRTRAEPRPKLVRRASASANHEALL